MFLTSPRSGLPDSSPRHRQHGVVLLVALIILVAMTLAGVALIRSVDTANVIAGNMAFQQSATNAGERSTEQALTRQIALASEQTLAKGYLPARSDPSRANNESWESFWTRLLSENANLRACVASPSGGGCATTPAPDAAGNSVQYIVQRLCTNSGTPHTATNPCTQAPPGATPGESFSTGASKPSAPKQVYYRITTRIVGPRNTVSYVQTIVAI